MNKGAVSNQLEQLTSQIVEAANPESVVLFGSQARGNATPVSDYDIALIFSCRDEVQSGLKRAHRALWPRQVPIDLVGFARETIQLGRTALAREILREGKALYQKYERKRR